jgi:hypothetical protein
VCSFRYGKEDEETMGLSFKKELTLADEQVFPPSKHMKSLGKTRLQAQYNIRTVSQRSYQRWLDKKKYPKFWAVLGNVRTKKLHNIKLKRELKIHKEIIMK